MTDSTDDQDGKTPKAYSRRELIGLVVALWLAGSLSDIRTLRLLYGLHGYGRFGFGGHPPPEYRDEDTASQ
ncbi:MAG: hypothetical protein R3324_04495 [Halobacteriales archaeon]|nr:hypothetical protein [Halobacteriales archaeon]